MNTRTSKGGVEIDHVDLGQTWRMMVLGEAVLEAVSRVKLE